ncbi:O-antigen/teichoic acid export membrane protein [Methanococcus voltae PS]|uniref:Heteropolysaccharide repeat unit export protein n=2 Tax=Methanococcus voltae TaxID=2188 RepID=Q2EMU9_METVO|nr:flippase [Methanococcus voltae]ABD17735.1 heteropolysaccharide repeat unit export protein [Methanococcus voltae PS]MCS3922227.1 O-antigen/teichoic acid export membrane protein [Methanococcus voltae PS]
MSYKQKAFEGISWNFMLRVLAGPIGYGVRMLYANYLPKTEVGLFYAMLDLLSILAVFRGLGVSYSLSVFIPKFKAKNDYKSIKSSVNFVFLFQTAFMLLMVALLLLLSPYVVNNYLNSTGQYTSNLLIAFDAFMIMVVGYFFFDGLLTIIRNILTGFQKQKYLATIIPSNITSIFLISVILLILGVNNVFVPVIAYSIVPILLIIIYGYLIFKKVYPEYFSTKSKISKDLSSQLLKFGVPLTLNSATSVILTCIDGVFLTIFTGLIAVAEYRNVATPTVTLLNMAVGSISVVLLPIISELWTLGKLKELNYAITNVFKYLMAMTLPLIIFLSYYTSEFITVFFNSSYLPVADAVRVLMASTLFSSVNAICFTILMGVGKPQIVTKFLYIGVLVNVILNFLLVPPFGSLGASITTLISYMIIQVLIGKYIKKNMKLEIKYKESFKLIIIGLLSLIPGILLNNFISLDLWKLLAGSIVYLVTYLMMVFGLKIIDIEEIISLVKK